jgi:hypothetical protein
LNASLGGERRRFPDDALTQCAERVLLALHLLEDFMHSSIRQLGFALALLAGAAVVSSGCYYGYASPAVGVGYYGGGPVVVGGYYGGYHHRYWGGGPWHHGYYGHHHHHH